MTTFIKLSLTSLMLFALACDTAKSSLANSKENTSKATVENSKQMELDLIKEGYSLGVITYLKDSKCSYIIIDEKSGAKFDPINIDDKKYSIFKSDGIKIFYKYRPLRMRNRCPEAQPIELEEAKTH